MPLPVSQLQPLDLADRLAEPGPPLLVDVRQPEEWQICHLAGAVHMPMSQLAQRLEELDRSREVVIYCHHGIRSQAAAEFLSRQGFERVWNLAGGIEAWSMQVDPGVARY